eukprot:gnl/Hemi2/6901_TR2353_c0_g1_i1.p1 gnl/Hemi2/6901_TR2353_c0_g1~~gnl/Hemi2/6901_TR2353_c0_g1_i1.p1  ORF type:complete len:354 (-),score=131.51 gnl/Hemi2/6901_TR2353_c0_g1_i1:124-1185(-)
MADAGDQLMHTLDHGALSALGGDLEGLLHPLVDALVGSLGPAADCHHLAETIGFSAMDAVVGTSATEFVTVATTACNDPKQLAPVPIAVLACLACLWPTPDEVVQKLKDFYTKGDGIFTNFRHNLPDPSHALSLDSSKLLANTNNLIPQLPHFHNDIYSGGFDAYCAAIVDMQHTWHAWTALLDFSAFDALIDMAHDAFAPLIELCQLLLDTMQDFGEYIDSAPALLDSILLPNSCVKCLLNPPDCYNKLKKDISDIAKAVNHNSLVPMIHNFMDSIDHLLSVDMEGPRHLFDPVQQQMQVITDFLDSAAHEALAAKQTRDSAAGLTNAISHGDIHGAVSNTGGLAHGVASLF